MKELSGMFEYYDERASEYDEIYKGGLPGMPEADLYRQDVEEIKAVCAGFGKGHLIDIGCGTAYWLPYYANNCSEITFVDQSRRMLAGCQKRAASLKLDREIHFIKSDFFEVRFLTKIFDSAVVAFLLSHLTVEKTKLFFGRLRRILRPRASILWIDGSWSSIRRKYRDKSGLQERKLKSGRAFTIFKRYFDERDIELFLQEYSLNREAFYFGEIFFAVSTTLSD